MYHKPLTPVPPSAQVKALLRSLDGFITEKSRKLFFCEGRQGTLTEGQEKGGPEKKQRKPRVRGKRSGNILSLE